MFKKAGFIYGVLFIGNLAAVCLHGCRCKADAPRYCTELRGVSIAVQDNGGLEPRPVFNRKVYAKALILSVSAREVQYECMRRMPALFNTAYAMCKEPGIKNGYSISGTRIVVDRDYDPAHPAGTDIRDLCLRKGNDYYLMAAPEDTSGTYTFTAQVVYEQFPQSVQDTLQASTAPLKLMK